MTLENDPREETANAKVCLWGLNFVKSTTGEKQQLWEPHVPFPSLWTGFLHTVGRPTLPPALSHYVQKHNQKTKMIHLCNFEKTLARPFIFSFTLWNYGLPCSPCRRDLRVTEVRSSNISWQIFSLHIYCFSSLCYLFLSRKRKYEIKWYGWHFLSTLGARVHVDWLAPYSSLQCSTLFLLYTSCFSNDSYFTDSLLKSDALSLILSNINQDYGKLRLLYYKWRIIT